MSAGALQAILDASEESSVTITDIILADEATGNLDRDTQKEIMDIFRELTNQGKCVILVSHSPDVADMCDKRYELTKISGKTKKKHA